MANALSEELKKLKAQRGGSGTSGQPSMDMMVTGVYNGPWDASGKPISLTGSLPSNPKTRSEQEGYLPQMKQYETQGPSSLGGSAYRNVQDQAFAAPGSSSGTSAATQAPATANAPSTGYTPTDWSAFYDQQYNAQLEALNAAAASQQAQLENQLPQVQQAYDTQRANSYTSARLSALGNNEALASQGLAGNAYAGPSSGFSELSRSNSDNALRNALNAAGLQQQNAEQDIQNQINQVGFSRDQAAAEALAAINAQKAQATQNENQFTANYNFQQQAQQESKRQFDEQMALQSEQLREQVRQFDTTTKNNMDQQAIENQRADKQLAQQQAQLDQAKYEFDHQFTEQQKQQALANAYQELSTFGMIKTKESAAALGVNVGTTLKSMSVKKKVGSGSNNKYELASVNAQIGLIQDEWKLTLNEKKTGEISDEEYKQHMIELRNELDSKYKEREKLLR